MDLNGLRNEINGIDRELASLFDRRMKVSLEIAKYKKENGLPVLDRAREREVLEKAASLAGEETEDYIRVLYSEIFNLSKAYQRKYISGRSPLSETIKEAAENTPKLFPEKTSVACQGVEGAYSQRACVRIFRYPVISYFENWDGVFEAVSSGECRYGILPVENSTAGSVNKVYDLMKKYDCRIVRSIRLRIDHSLLTKKGASIGDIREILSHEQAINQCSDFISSLDNVKVTVVRNTAAAAKLVAESGRTDAAAISSADCAELYGLQETASAIQNVKNNYTRFICISNELEIYPGADRTSIIMTTLHKPGALYSVLSKFNAHGINLLKLESRPVPERDFEFSFYFDIEASIYGEDLYSLFDELYAEGCSFTYLGSYTEIF